MIGDKADVSWDKWKQESPENRALLEDVKMMEAGIPFKKQTRKQIDTKKSWDKLAQRIEQSASENVVLKHKNSIAT